MTRAPRIDRGLLRIAMVTMIGSFATLLDTSIINVSLRTLERRFDTGLPTLQWVVTAYILAMATVIPISGWAARRFGPRRVYIVSLTVFTCGSGLCGAAWSVQALIAFRVLQGLGGAMLVPIGMMIMATAAGPSRLTRAMSVTSLPVMLAPVLGPVIGGLLVDGPGWRWIFYVNVPLGVIGVFLARRRLPSVAGQRAQPLDTRGLALLATGLPAFTYALAELGRGAPLAAARTLVPAVAGPLLIGLFVRHALRCRSPLVDVRLFRNPTFTVSTLCAVSLTGTMFGSLILLPLYFQQLRGEDALTTGLLLIPQGIATAFAPLLTGRLVDRIGNGRVVFAGSLIALAGTLPLAFIGPSTPLPHLAVVMLVRGFGSGMATIPAFGSAFKRLETEHVPDATILLQLATRIGGSLGSAVFSIILARSLMGAGGLAAQGHGFEITFACVAAATAAATVPAALLMRLDRWYRVSAASPSVEAAAAPLA